MNSGATDIFASPTPFEVLVLGYGNLLRTDDGAGPIVVNRLAEFFREASFVECVTAHQLLPEHSELLCNTRRVIFIDASVAISPGKVRISRVTPREVPSHALTHHVATHSLLAMAKFLFGRAPRAWSVEIGAVDLCVGEQLSPRVAQTCERLVTHLEQRIRSWSSPSKSSAFYASKEGSHVCS